MGKKRTFELGRSWRLGKLAADYKAHKINKKSLGYLKDPIMRRKKTTKCEHDYVLVELKKYSFLKNSAFEVYECSKCKKHKWKSKCTALNN